GMVIPFWILDFGLGNLDQKTVSVLYQHSLQFKLGSDPRGNSAIVRVVKTPITPSPSEFTNLGEVNSGTFQ
ncbi:MAG TPA: hypothetical protein V6C65_11250, partial [Allocoleopsis sp.]